VADERILLGAADSALYEAKDTGRNKSVRAR
jgi:PleD family two-component response regulator